MVEDETVESTTAMPQIPKKTITTIRDVGKEDDIASVGNTVKDEVDIMVDALKLGI